MLNSSTFLSILAVGFVLSACVKPSGLSQSFRAELPVEGMITFTD